MELEKVAQEFMEYELDPNKINTKKISETLMLIKDTLSLSSTAEILKANATIASLYQIISFKANRCSYWEQQLKHDLEYLRLQTKYRLLAESRTADSKLTKEALDDKIELDEAVADLSKRVLACELGRKFWDRMLDTLGSVAHRVDSAGMQLGVQAKLSPRGVQ